MGLIKKKNRVLNFINGKDKFPLVEFENNKYAQIFPVTKYQFERYIWEMAPDIDYDKILQANPRISPDEVNGKPIKSLFITNINFNEAIGFANYLGGRLPKDREVDSIYSVMSEIKLKELLHAININGTDVRCSIYLKKIFNILQQHGKIVDVKAVDIIKISNIDELCSSMPVPPYRPIYTRNIKKGLSHLVGIDACDTRFENAGFRVIVESR